MPKGNTEATAALALNAGVDLEMGSSQWPMHLASAVRSGKTSEANVTRSVKRALRPLFRAGRFDPVEQVEWAHLNTSVVNSTAHQEAIFDAALQVTGTNVTHAVLFRTLFCLNAVALCPSFAQISFCSSGAQII
jgi:beta-glucosidase-like glycosyl hydrolase